MEITLITVLQWFERHGLSIGCHWPPPVARLSQVESFEAYLYRKVRAYPTSMRLPASLVDIPHEHEAVRLGPVHPEGPRALGYRSARWIPDRRLSTAKSWTSGALFGIPAQTGFGWRCQRRVDPHWGSGGRMPPRPSSRAEDMRGGRSSPRRPHLLSLLPRR